MEQALNPGQFEQAWVIARFLKGDLEAVMLDSMSKKEALNLSRL